MYKRQAQLIQTAERISPLKIFELEPRLNKLFGAPPEKSIVNEKSIRLYLALKQVVEAEKFDFYTIQSFPCLLYTSSIGPISHNLTASLFLD